MEGMIRRPGRIMGQPIGKRECDKEMVRIAISASSLFGEEAYLSEVDHMMQIIHKKKFNKKYLSELREEVLAERAELVERLSTPESARKLMEEWGLL